MVATSKSARSQKKGYQALEIQDCLPDRSTKEQGKSGRAEDVVQNTTIIF
jgi:hypothetical protein